jgi:UPF0755 protein
MRRSTVVSLFVFFVLAGIAFTGRLAFDRFVRPYKGYDASEQFVELVQGDGSQTMARKLTEAGVIRDRWAFRVAVWRRGAGRRLKAGEYRFDRPMTVEDVVDKIARGDVYQRSITFPEGLSIAEMSRLFESHGFGPAADFVAAARDASLIRDLDRAAKDLEGYLFPETYLLARRAGPTELVQMMVRRFRQVLTDDMAASLRRQGRSLREAVTLASIVEKETASADERPTVAGVYRKRLEIGMPLQCDPTVIFALERLGRYHGNLTRENLQVDSPYNTYKYPGLPPGPIASPGRSSLEAAVSPREVDYLYFVSRNDGTHVFAATLDEHNRNVRKYQVEYFRQKRQAQAR